MVLGHNFAVEQKTQGTEARWLFPGRFRGSKAQPCGWILTTCKQFLDFISEFDKNFSTDIFFSVIKQELRRNFFLFLERMSQLLSLVQYLETNPSSLKYEHAKGLSKIRIYPQIYDTDRVYCTKLTKEL